MVYVALERRGCECDEERLEEQVSFPCLQHKEVVRGGWKK